jgi:hypothetical protein
VVILGPIFPYRGEGREGERKGRRGEVEDREKEVEGREGKREREEKEKEKRSEVAIKNLLARSLPSTWSFWGPYFLTFGAMTRGGAPH